MQIYIYSDQSERELYIKLQSSLCVCMHELSLTKPAEAEIIHLIMRDR